jgi:hypothetical protein
MDYTRGNIMYYAGEVSFIPAARPKSGIYQWSAALPTIALILLLP